MTLQHAALLQDIQLSLLNFDRQMVGGNTVMLRNTYDNTPVRTDQLRSPMLHMDGEAGQTYSLEPEIILPDKLTPIACLYSFRVSHSAKGENLQMEYIQDVNFILEWQTTPFAVAGSSSAAAIGGIEEKFQIEARRCGEIPDAARGFNGNG